MTGSEARAAVAAAAATLLGACALTPVYSSGAWFPTVFAVVAVVLAGGLLLRLGGPALWSRARPGRPNPEGLAAVWVVVVPLGQLVLLLCLLTVRFAPGHALAGVLPTRRSMAKLASVLTEGSAELREQATPALPLTGLLALTALFVGLVAVTVDLVAVAGRQAALAGLGLLVLYCVPVATITGGIGLVALAAPTAGLALLLWADQNRRLGSREGPRLSTGAGAAVRIGLSALVTALVLGSVLPTLAEGSLSTGLGGGDGSSTGTALDPAAALRGSLTKSQPIGLLSLDASVQDPGYLRAVSLDRYDNARGWSMSNLSGETSIVGDVPLAPLPAAEPSRPVSATIATIGHDDRFLPVLSSPLAVLMDDSGDDWRFDPATGTVFGRDVTTGGHTYRVSASEPRPTAARLAQAAPLAPGSGVQQRFTALPQLDPRITDLATKLTAGATGPYDRVRRIHEYLTDRSNGFVYSLSTEPGTSGDDLVDFLRLKRGYCEQYAGAMAVLVRAAGVPARVALGYTPGTRQRDGTRLITSDDAHAWVEVYFEDLGWVPFDPTPIAVDRAVDLPWAPRAGAVPGPGIPADVSAPALPAPAPTAPRQDRAADGAPVPTARSDTGLPVRQVLIGAGIALLVIALGAAPGTARAVQRRRRLAQGTAGALWDELGATALDTDVPLRPAWTPRQTARELDAVLHRPDGEPDEGAADAVARLALAEEAASYGPVRGAVASPELITAVRTARRGLLRAAPRRARLRARLWPASLVAGAGSRLAAAMSRRAPHLPRRTHDSRARGYWSATGHSGSATGHSGGGSAPRDGS